MFDELKVGHEVEIAAWVRVPRKQLGCRCWPPAHYLRSAGHVQGAFRFSYKSSSLAPKLSPADFDGASPISSTNVVLPHPLHPSALLGISDETEKHIRIGGRFVQEVRCK